MSFLDEFFGTGTFSPQEDADETSMHQGGLDQIGPAYDPMRISLLTGAIGFDPADYSPSLLTEESVEKALPQWGPPFIKFVDGRITELEKKVDKATEKWSFETRTDVIIASMQTTATGGVDIITVPNAVLYEPPPGFTIAIHRFSIVDAAHNLGTPYTAANGYWELRVNGDTLVGNSMISGQGQLPIFASWGTRDAMRIRDGEVLSLFMSGGPVSTMLKIRMQISLDRTIEG